MFSVVVALANRALELFSDVGFEGEGSAIEASFQVFDAIKGWAKGL
jgi:hypothetical protein